MSEFDHNHNDETPGLSRRRVLECMTWAGTGVLWTISAACRIRWALSVPRMPLKPPA